MFLGHTKMKASRSNFIQIDNLPKYYDYGHMPSFIAECISSWVLRSLQNELRKNWNRYDFKVSKSVMLYGGGASIVIDTPEGKKNYRITVREVK